MNFKTRDYKIDGVTSSMLANSIKNFNTDKQEERMRIVEDILSDKYWIEYFDEYEKVNLSQSDSLSDMNTVNCNIEQLANYILYSPDGEKPSRQEYKFYRDKEKFYKKSHSNVPLMVQDAHGNNTDRIIDVLIEEQQYIKAKNIVYKRSMIKNEYCKGYEPLLSFLEDKSNISVASSNIIKAQIKLKEEIENLILEKEKLKTIDYKYHELGCEISEKKRILAETSNRLTNIMIWFNKSLKELREDIRLSHIVATNPIDMKRITNDYCEPPTLNFFDTFDIVDDFDNIDTLRLIAQVGSSTAIKNHVENILCTNGVYETREAMEMLSELINYYVFKASFDGSSFMIFNYFRVGKTQEWIAEKIGVTHSMVGKSIVKSLTLIQALHRKNIHDVYSLNFIKDKPIKKVCSTCKKEKELSEFRNNSLGKYGKRARCKECDKLIYIG